MGDEFPFTLPMLKRGGPRITFEKPVTIFAGENGTGKSSLIEAIARSAGYNVKGGSRSSAARTGMAGSPRRCASPGT